jgi:SAM-dependent methyltransferase
MGHAEEQRSTCLGVADEIRDFYDQYPYPRPIDSLEQYRQLWLDPRKRRADYHLFWPDKSYRDDFSILIAGCGTSQAAKHALRWPAARVTGIDVSATSVDQIVCTGVLHHLVDPDAGLRALRGVLEPDGAMHLMVYALYGRTGIYMLQEFCRRLGIRATDDEIPDLIAALRALPPNHPLEQLLREAPDFRQEAALADALLHPQDRAYSAPQFVDFVENAGLTFGRWVKQAPYSPHCGVIAQLPQSSRLARLCAIEQFAAVELFRGTMVRHSAVVYRNDNPGRAERVSFAGDVWLDYVPIRMPDTICVQERLLPPGAAAVLINQAHTYRDLFLSIDAPEKRLFDAIDGNRRLGEIVERTLPFPGNRSPLDTARRFFERLWRYDQIVFDTSLRAEDSASGPQA